MFARDALPVLDENDRLVGIVTEADVVRGRFPRDPRSRITAGREPDTFDDPIDQHVAVVLARSVPGVISARATSTDE